jgi:hypothetical protein
MEVLVIAIGYQSQHQINTHAERMSSVLTMSFLEFHKTSAKTFALEGFGKVFMKKAPFIL